MKITVIGCGVMGSAFAREFAKAGHQLTLCDRNQDKGESLAGELNCRYIDEESQAVGGADIVLLAIKPKDLQNLADQLEDLESAIVVSILSGTKIDLLKNLFPDSSIVRTMPNLALTCGESVIGVCKDPTLPHEVKKTVDSLFHNMGLVFWTEESKIDAVSALAGSGPAFVIAMIEAMVESGIVMGFRSDEALQLAMQTVIGAVALIQKQSHHPGEIRWQICSPGGTTIEGIRTFEKEGIRGKIIETFLATYQKNKVMQ